MFVKRLLLTTSVISLGLALPALAHAETPAPAPSATAPQTDDHGSLVFQPEFFAAYRPNTALEMVNRVPGFSLDDGDDARGFEGAVGNVLVNGSRPASKSDKPSSVLGRIVASQVERIELVRGGAPGIEMQGYALVVNVILKGTASTEHILSHNSFIYDGGKSLFGGGYQVTHRKGEYTYGLSLTDNIASSDSVGEGPYRRFGPDGTLLRDEAYTSAAYGGGSSIRGSFAGPLLGGTVNITARYGISDWVNNSQQTAVNIARDNRYSREGDNSEFGLTYTRSLSDRIRSETRISYDTEDSEIQDSAKALQNGTQSPEQLFKADTHSSESILRSVLRYQHSNKLELEAGGEVAFNTLDVDQAYSVGGVNVPLPSASVTVEEVRGELFGKGTWKIAPTMTLEGGLRLEHSTISQSGDVQNEESFFFAKPRLQLTWTPRENTQFRARFERSVGQLNFEDFAASSELGSDDIKGGNVNLTPEQRWISEISFEHRFWKEGIFSIAYRHDAISDAIDVIPLDGGLSAVGNIGDGTLDQLRVNFALPTDRLFIPGGRVKFENTWNKTEVTDPTSGRKRPMSGVRPSQAQISFEQNIAALKISWGADWMPRMSQYTYQPDYVSGWDGKDYYQLWVDYKPVPSLSIRAQVTVWDSFYWQREAYADRSTRPIDYTEVRDVAPRPFYQLRLRKTF
ncbi:MULTISPECIES: TonB-dependent receptor plug domain-containing protein [unclassified Brevundimonas]|uniref:TonB-dependent receptor plug domain-containing protein n=1 Tax=unclassified Brevundimonas TaxID=2622653 RepID=UPI0025B8704D|nr:MULTISPECIES: TonB-dependent receptor [unclassified Brevundimonas]